MGVTPSPAVHHPREHRSLTFAADRRRIQLVCDFYVPEVHAGVLDFARSAGWSVFDWNCYAQSLRGTYDEPCDGMLAIAALPELQGWIKKQSCPVVRLLCSDETSESPAVGQDFAAIGERAAEHLLSLGSPSLAFYRYLENNETRKIWEGLSGVLAKAGRTARLLDYKADTHDAKGARNSRWNWLRDQLASMPRPVAILTEDDRFAIDAVEAASMLGWRIPEDLAVLGSDNRAMILAKVPIPVSSVDTNLHGVGWAGAQLLDRILNGEAPPSKPVLISPGRVVARHSTATFFCDHPGLSAAVTYLRAHHHEGIRIEDVARVAGLSKRSLQLGFKEELGCTVSEELARLRLDHARRLLAETNLKLDSVAFESGLRNAKYLCEVFRPVFGKTPAAYREAERGKNKGTA